MKKEKCYVGIDPGSTGGSLALIGEDVADLCIFIDFRSVEEASDVMHILQDYDVQYGVVENIPAGRMASAHGLMQVAMFMFLRMGIPHQAVSPATWQKAMLGSFFGHKAPKSASKAKQARARKERSVLAVNALYPWLQMQYKENDKCDALLMALYGRKYWREMK